MIKIIKRISDKFIKQPSVIKSNLGENVNLAILSDIRFSLIGDYTSIGRYSKITHTKIGKFCSISWDVTINASNHYHNHVSTHSFSKRPDYKLGAVTDLRSHSLTTIENDVWIGANSVILPGLNIGNGVIIGAGSVVTKDIPDYAIVVGVPAKIIKYRFEASFIERLIKLKWWDFDKETIRKNIHLFQSEMNDEILSQLEKLKQ